MIVKTDRSFAALDLSHDRRHVIRDMTTTLIKSLGIFNEKSRP